MQQATLTKLALLVFGLVFLSFVVRGFGQFVVGPRRATMVAGPLAVLAVGVLVVVLTLWILEWAGVVSIEPMDAEGRNGRA